MRGSGRVRCAARRQRGRAAPAGENRPDRHDAGALARLRLAHVDDDVMHVRAIAGAHFARLHPAVLGEVGRDLEVLVVDGAACGHLDSRPASRTPDRACQSASPPRTSAAPAVSTDCLRGAPRIDPRDDRVDLALG